MSDLPGDAFPSYFVVALGGGKGTRAGGGLLVFSLVGLAHLAQQLTMEYGTWPSSVASATSQPAAARTVETICSSNSRNDIEL